MNVEVVGHPSNILFRGDADGDAIAALQLYANALRLEARIALSTVMGEPPDQTDREMAERFQKVAGEADLIRSKLERAYHEAELKLADDIEDEEIAECLRDGIWSRMAI
jgi:hypothetical protein